MDFARIMGCVQRNWAPGSAGVSSSDGLVALICLGFAAVCFVIVRRQGRAAGRGFWTGLGIMLALLGVARLADLDTGLSAGGRCFARVGGWYAERQDIQQMLMFWVVVAVGLGAAVIMLTLRGRLLRNIPALIGLTGLLALIGLRLVSAHGVDAWLHGYIAGMPRHLVLDLLALSIIGVSLLWHMAAPRPVRRRRRRRHGSRGEPVRRKRRSSRGRPSDGPLSRQPQPSQAT
ncbi:MAG: hypothetical protein Q4G14_13630 [Paracoccus sp. (in: a-proteobacteria)]|uniref:hypothetical protein n=1 Tax=Paracoccus sp. TaxID=267 RepID=UPI0026DEE5F3|nr:hypothetical protein [Paracoccus sp. (in: a-proteobacteria)]MDO5614266.1 hypothetical protein [Paracoccus sp. (in: a-proteobacteria)]